MTRFSSIKQTKVEIIYSGHSVHWCLVRHKSQVCAVSDWYESQSTGLQWEEWPKKKEKKALGKWSKNRPSFHPLFRFGGQQWKTRLESMDSVVRIKSCLTILTQFTAHNMFGQKSGQLFLIASERFKLFTAQCVNRMKRVPKRRLTITSAEPSVKEGSLTMNGNEWAKRKTIYIYIFDEWPRVHFKCYDMHVVYSHVNCCYDVYRNNKCETIFINQVIYFCIIKKSASMHMLFH